MRLALCLLPLALTFLLPMAGFSQQSPAASKTLATTPVSTELVETDTQALLSWRRLAQLRPTLLLFSNDPFLEPIPEAILPRALKLARNGSESDILARAVRPSSNPVLLPGMGLSAALEAGFFSHVVWVLPLDEGAGMPGVEQVRKQLLDHGVINPEEAASLVTNGEHISGTIHHIPFAIHGSGALPELTAPAWVHIDLSYFASRYRNEIKTPVYTLVGEELKLWQKQSWPVLGTSISFGNLLGNVPLGMRFLGRDLKQILEHPAMLDDPLPRTWELRARALYLENFFKKEEMLKIFNEMDRLEPENPDVLYSLYLVQRRFKKGNEALKLLAEAVKRDQGYALEYYLLAETALQKKRPQAALRMLGLAQARQPENPVPLLKQIAILDQIGHRQPIRLILEQLQKMAWSETYYAEMPRQLNAWAAQFDKTGE